MKIGSIFCFKCYCEGKKLPIGEEYYMFPVDRPYMNIFFHRDCYKQISGQMSIYLTENEKILQKYIEKPKK